MYWIVTHFGVACTPHLRRQLVSESGNTPDGRLSTRTRAILVSLLALLAAVVVFGIIAGGSGSSHSSSSASTPSYSGDPYMNPTSAPDQSLTVVDGFTWGGVSGSIADALRYCQDTPADGGTNVQSFKPCLNSVAVYGIQDNDLTTIQAAPDYAMKLDPDGALQYSTGDDTLFATAVRYKAPGNPAWSNWQYASDPTDYSYQDGYDYQIALFGYDRAHESHGNPAVKLPQDFAWNTFMPLMLRNQ